MAVVAGVPEDPTWWQRDVIYQIYPRSIFDTSRDGIGDLAGIRERADYLAWLGIGAVWLSPIYPSPDADLGYDSRITSRSIRGSGRWRSSMPCSPRCTSAASGWCSISSRATPRTSGMELRPHEGIIVR